jgi:Na+/H+ antiporter NhaC
VALGRVELRLDGAPVEDADTLVLARRSLARGLRQQAAAAGLSLAVDGETEPVPDGLAFRIEHDARADHDGELVLEDRSAGRALRVSTPWTPPSRSSVFPPFIAIALAILVRRPVVALFAGVWTATFLLRIGSGSSYGAALLLGLPDVVTDFFWPEVSDPYRQQIIGFVVCMLAMVGIMTKSGGIKGLMNVVARFASSVRSTQIATWCMGIVVFFDDYANCILVGTTMRPLADRFRISREKLAYLVDATAAPVAGLSIFSTWIAYEVSTFSAQLPAAGLLTTDGYAVFLETLPFRYYCILSLFLAFVVAFSGRDFGPMLTAERRARTTGQLVREGGQPMVGEAATAMEASERVTPRAHRALIPLAVFLGLTLYEIVRVGSFAAREAGTWSAGNAFTLEGIADLLSNGDSTRALLVGSSSGMVVAALLAAAGGLRGEIAQAAWTTLRSMGIAIAILFLAWMIGAACGDERGLGTAPYLTVLLSDHLRPEVLPIILFLLSALIAFSTGSSWSTMSILLPLVVGLSYHLGETLPMGGHALMVISIGSVLEGSIFGDHCSPISDTTVLSSQSSGCNHIAHVWTQLPYAIVVAVVVIVCGTLPVGYGLPIWPMLALGCVVLFGVLMVVGRRSSDD